MDYSVGLAQSQRVIKQRNALGLAALVLAALVVILFLVGATRDREIVLQPIARTPLTLSSSGVSEDYLEMVTRDTALMTLREHAERINREAAALDDKGRRLEDAASYAETHGYSLTEDMSQYVASRYFELQHGEYGALNAPDIFRTNLSHDQRMARDEIVKAAMRDYVEGPRGQVAPRLEERDVVNVVAPRLASVEQMSGSVAHHVSGRDGPAGEDPARAARRAAITDGGAEAGAVVTGLQETHTGSVIGAADLQREHAEGTDTRWHAKRR